MTLREEEPGIFVSVTGFFLACSLEMSKVIAVWENEKRLWSLGLQRPKRFCYHRLFWLWKHHKFVRAQSHPVNWALTLKLSSFFVVYPDFLGSALSDIEYTKSWIMIVKIAIYIYMRQFLEHSFTKHEIEWYLYAKKPIPATLLWDSTDWKIEINFFHFETCLNGETDIRFWIHLWNRATVLDSGKLTLLTVRTNSLMVLFMWEPDWLAI